MTKIIKTLVISLYMSIFLTPALSSGATLSSQLYDIDKTYPWPYLTQTLTNLTNSTSTLYSITLKFETLIATSTAFSSTGTTDIAHQLRFTSSDEGGVFRDEALYNQSPNPPAPRKYDFNVDLSGVDLTTVGHINKIIYTYTGGTFYLPPNYKFQITYSPFNIDRYGQYPANSMLWGFLGSSNPNSYGADTYNFLGNSTTTIKDAYFKVDHSSIAYITLSRPVSEILHNNPVVFTGTTNNPQYKYDGILFRLYFHGLNNDDTGYKETGTYIVNNDIKNNLNYAFTFNGTLSSIGWYSWKGQLINTETGEKTDYSSESYFYIDDLTATTTATSTLAQLPEVIVPEPAGCSIGNISGCFINALTYLFTPKNLTIIEYQMLWDNIKHKPPIGYFSIIRDTLGGLNVATGTSAFALADMSALQENFFTPINNFLKMILWFVFGFSIFNRFKHINL